MYTCGPTVYDFAHIGNFRTFTFLDICAAGSAPRGFALDHVMNITDVDDKIIRNAVAAGQVAAKSTRHVYTKPFWTTAHTLRLERPERLVRATEHIPDMVEAIEKLTATRLHLYAATARSISASPSSPNTASCRTTISAACGPARAWTWTSTIRPMPAISSCGRRRRKASRVWDTPIGRAARAGTSSAP